MSTASPTAPTSYVLDDAAAFALPAGRTHEWLLTDGRGGYASGTVSGCPTRRYHAWLAAPLASSPRRHVFLARCEDWIETPTESFCLAAARYPGSDGPGGERWQVGFELRPHPTFTYRLGRGLTVRREIRMLPGQSTVLVRWSLRGGGSGGVKLRLRPLLACREADALTFANASADPACVPISDGRICQPYPALPRVSITWSAGAATVDADPVWYRGIEYAADLARGYDGNEDLLSPFVVSMPLREGAEVVLAATIDQPIADPRREFDRLERADRKATADPAAPAARLSRAADDFLFRDPAGRLTVCAGWPWFGEWGRDTFIALPGLTLARGRPDLCADVLAGVLPFFRDGLLPNIFGRTPADSDYGSVDAALWFSRAVGLYAESSSAARARVVDEFLPALQQIVDGYRAGHPRLGIAVDAEGLLRAGAPDLNPTWMDAKTATGPVTPRHGYAVELNALWYALHCQVRDLLQTRKDRAAAKRLDQWLVRMKKAFVDRFWLRSQGYLADRVLEGRVDDAVRPNMVLAAALADSPLTKPMRRRIVGTAAGELLTPRGLRTLAATDPAYRPRYEGGPESRDNAYHQGTVWPWLLGFYVEASLRAERPTRKLCTELRGLWDGMVEELDQVGLGHLSEVFDGDPPHRPGGTIAQAWNIGEWLRSLALLDAAMPAAAGKGKRRR